MIKFFSFLTAGFMACFNPVLAINPTNQSSIAAVVNDSTILTSELNARIKLFLLSSGMKDTPENRKQILEQMLKRMIDEKLKMQWVKKFDFTAPAAEIEESYESVAARNNMSKAQLDQFLKINNIPKEALLHHIRADIVWHNYIKERHQSTVQVNSQDVKARLAEYQSNKAQEQVYLNEIVLFYDKGDAAEKKSITAYAQKLVNEVQRGANFGMVAQQSSHSPSASLGGDIGWVLTSRLDDESKKAVGQMQPGQIRIVQMQNGVRILMLKHKRVGGAASQVDTMISFSQALIPLPANPTFEGLEDLYKKAVSVAQNARSCDGLSKLAKAATPSAMVKMNNDVPASNLNPQMRDMLMKMAINKASAPMRIEEGFMIIMVAKKEKVSPSDPKEDDIQRSIIEQKLGQLSQRELRNLRRVASIELRV